MQVYGMICKSAHIPPLPRSIRNPASARQLPVNRFAMMGIDNSHRAQPVDNPGLLRKTKDH
jgi:hypothetical protein